MYRLSWETLAVSFAPGGQSQIAKKLPKTDLIFDNIQAEDHAAMAHQATRLSLDCKATVALGDDSQWGKTRGDTRARDHDIGAKEKYIPCSLVDEDSGKLYLEFGSSYKTSDFIADVLENWWPQLSPAAQRAIAQIQLKVDNGPESNGIHTQFLNRIVAS
ncbi:MAG: hypothetical protein AAGE59_12390 [Cyanobacteria bacterium P01_F01_bin.86]